MKTIIYILSNQGLLFTVVMVIWLILIKLFPAKSKTLKLK